MTDGVAVATHGKGRSASAQDNRTGRTREIPSLSSGLMNQTWEIPSLFASCTNHARETPSLFSGATLPVLDMLRSPLEHRTSQEVLYGFLNARAAVRNQSRVSCPETRGSLKAPARSRTGAASHELSRWLYDARGQSASRSILRRSTCKPYAPRWADNAENRPDRPAVKIGLIGRLFLTSDGTVTAMLEQLSGEQIVTARLHQSDGTGGPGDHRTHVVAAASLVTRTTPPGWGHLGPGFRAGEVGVLGEHHARDGAC